jgi:carboxypeptidase Taq
VIQRDLPNLEKEFESGKFSSLLDWLREKIHRHGAKFEPQQLVQRVTGSKINGDAYIRYLQTKFGEIYGL